MTKHFAVYTLFLVMLIILLNGHHGLTHDVEYHSHVVTSASTGVYHTEYRKNERRTTYYAYASASLSTPSQQGLSVDGSHTADIHNYEIVAEVPWGNIFSGKKKTKKGKGRGEFFVKVMRDKMKTIKGYDEPTFTANAKATTSIRFVVDAGDIDDLQDSEVIADEITFDNPKRATRYYKWRKHTHNHDSTGHYPPGTSEYHTSD